MIYIKYWKLINLEDGHEVLFTNHYASFLFRLSFGFERWEEKEVIQKHQQ